MEAPVNIAELRHKILIKSRSAGTPDANGQRAYTYSTFAETRAKIGPVTSGEVERAHSFGSRTNFKITIRYRPGIISTMQVVYAGGGTSRTFLVNGVIDPDESRILLFLFCEELNAAAEGV